MIRFECSNISVSQPDSEGMPDHETQWLLATDGEELAALRTAGLAIPDPCPTDSAGEYIVTLPRDLDELCAAVRLIEATCDAPAPSTYAEVDAFLEAATPPAGQ